MLDTAGEARANSLVICILIYMVHNDIYIFTNPTIRAGCDTRSIS